MNRIPPYAAALLTLATVAAAAEVSVVDCGPDHVRLRTGDYELAYAPHAETPPAGWITITRTGKEGFAIATKLANGQHLDVTDAAAGEGDIYRWTVDRKDAAMFRSLACRQTDAAIEIVIRSERQWARFESRLLAYRAHPGLLHWTVTATTRTDKAFCGQVKPDCHFMVDGKVTDWDQGITHDVVRYSVQRGPTAPAVFFRDLPMDSYVFYFEDLTSLNDLYRLTRCDNPYDYPVVGNPGAVQMGAAESYFQMSSPDGADVQPLAPYQPPVRAYKQFGYHRPAAVRVPAGTTLTLADTYLYLRPVDQPDHVTACRHFVEMLADIYPHVRKPPLIETDWAGTVVPRMINDILRPENNSVVNDTHHIPRAYVAYRHEDNQLWTVLNLLHPLELYVRRFPEQAQAAELYRRLNDCLPLFFDRDWGGFHNTMAPINQDQYFTVVYIFSQAVMMADLALLGNDNARTMITGFRDTLLRMGAAYDYAMADIWLRDFSKQKTFYQADATCCYLYVMMALYELSDGQDAPCLAAARAAADKLAERGFDLMWEANMTAAGVVGCEKLFRATGATRYRDLAYVPLANLLREAWLWECDYGIGEKTTNFWAFSGCPAAPCSAEFENHRTRLHFKDYVTRAADHLPANVAALLDDAWRRGPTQSRFTLPPLVIEAGAKDILPAEGKLQTNCGEIRHDQMIPLEDYRVGWGTDLEWWQNNARPGVVGQEIYGAGGPIWYALWQDELATHERRTP